MSILSKLRTKGLDQCGKLADIWLSTDVVLMDLVSESVVIEADIDLRMSAINAPGYFSREHRQLSMGQRYSLTCATNASAGKNGAIVELCEGFGTLG